MLSDIYLVQTQSEDVTVVAILFAKGILRQPHRRHFGIRKRDAESQKVMESNLIFIFLLRVECLSDKMLCGFLAFLGGTVRTVERSEKSPCLFRAAPCSGRP